MTDTKTPPPETDTAPPATCEADIDAMTEAAARRWLVANDREAADYWAACPEGDLRQAVRDNCRDFGYDDAPERDLPPDPDGMNGEGGSVTKQRYTVHVYREMKLRFDGIEADTPDAAAEAARDMPFSDADDFDECDGVTLAALVDEADDEEYSRSRTIDFEAGLLLAKAPVMHAALATIARMLMDGEQGEDGVPFVLDNDDAVDSLHSCIDVARRALGYHPYGDTPNAGE